MAHGSHQVRLEMPIERIWDFISDINNWAPLVPGYLEHEIINQEQSIWKLHGDIGMIKKTVNLKVDIIKWHKPTHIAFRLTRLNESAIGTGYFKAKTLADLSVEMSGYLNISAKGMLGQMVNPILNTFVPVVGKEFTEKVATKILERDRERLIV
ncbi:CoxG family protein [Oceanobacillus chungangensis]|uniref:SRPBCC family protein n=1 Tax=Oceanobacillus chungangensis TaxID=1229152 RepID=A0A3D8PIU0_9BACI|nr:SRPBCC family protein [Oceanobacillus chungangensis]RDW15562.1 SRPBCC family protein [Oceanobacillus chungangensis]